MASLSYPEYAVYCDWIERTKPNNYAYKAFSIATPKTAVLPMTLEHAQAVIDSSNAHVNSIYTLHWPPTNPRFQHYLTNTIRMDEAELVDRIKEPQREAFVEDLRWRLTQAAINHEEVSCPGSEKGQPDRRLRLRTFEYGPWQVLCLRRTNLSRVVERPLVNCGPEIKHEPRGTDCHGPRL